MRVIASVACIFIALTSCQRERRQSRPAPAQAAALGDAARESDLQPGGPLPVATVSSPYDGNAAGISEGQRWFAWYNCSGCHSHGGGGIGPPLIKQNWIYGGQPANLFDTIVKGRPNGMPAWGGRIPSYQIWQIVSYIRSMNQQEPASATPVRTDELEFRSMSTKRRIGGGQ